MMTTEEMIIQISGTNRSECDCDRCKNLCRTPGLGTPEDIESLIKAGYKDQLVQSVWIVGVIAGLTDKPVMMIQPKQEVNGWCTFRTPDGLCELHDKGLKPLECILASCRPKPIGWTLQKDFTWLIAKTWLPFQKAFIKTND